MCRPKYVEQLRNIGIINSTTRFHLVGSFYEIWINNLQVLLLLFLLLLLLLPLLLLPQQSYTWVLVLCTRSFQAFLSSASWPQFLGITFFNSFITSSLHLFFGRPLVLTPPISNLLKQFYIFHSVRRGRDFPHLSRPALGPTQPPVQWVQGLSRG